MKRYAHDEITPAKSNLDKKEQVENMFNSIAGTYDFLNHTLSIGVDRQWRKKALLELKKTKPKTLLDVATGTADVAILAYKLLKPKKITGIDIAESMLNIGKKKIKKSGLEKSIELEKGDAENIRYPDNFFDGITVSFGVRNFQNLEKGLAEMYRVLKPGGKLVVLEFSKPKQKLFKTFYNLYLNFLAPAFGKVFAKNKSAYKYLKDSILAFPEREQFLAIMNKTGYTATYYRALSLGICCIYCGSKSRTVLLLP